MPVQTLSFDFVPESNTTHCLGHSSQDRASDLHLIDWTCAKKLYVNCVS